MLSAMKGDDMVRIRRLKPARVDSVLMFSGREF